MNRMIFGLGGAAVVVLAAVLALGLYFNNPGVGTPPSPSPTIEPSPIASPSPVTNLPSWYTTSETPTGAGVLAAGSHETMAFRPAFTFSVPEGWVNDTDDASYFFLFPNTPANQAWFARSEELAQVILTGMHPTPWFTCESLEDNRGAAAADMVAAASTNEALAVSDQVEVAIGGLTGMQFDVRRNPDWTGTCPEDSELPAGLDPEDQRTRAIFLDVPGRSVLVILLSSASSAAHEAFLAEAMPIVESFQFSQ
jgi:hypothetical protein